MSAFRGILTGYGMAAIKNKEAKDNAKMEIVKSAGIDFLENKIPQHEKEMKLYDSDYKAVELIHGTDIANLFGDAEAGFYGTGKGLQLVNQVLEKNNISKDKIKNFKFSTQDERIAKKKSAFQSKKDQVLNLTGIGGIGTETAKNQLEGFGKDDSMMDTQTQVTDQSQTTDTTTQDTEEAPKLKTDISSLFTPKPDVQGVETKFNSISKAVNEQMQYGSPIYNQGDGTTTFNISDELRTTSNAHIRIASVMTQNDDNINQLDAVSRSKQELDNQTVTPFNIISSSIGGNYIAGNNKQPALITGGKGGSIDVNTVIKSSNFEGSIRQFLENVYANVLLDDGQGNTDSAVFAKFLENIPDNLVINAGTKDEQKYKEVIASSHALKNYYKNY